MTFVNMNGKKKKRKGTAILKQYCKTADAQKYVA